MNSEEAKFILSTLRRDPGADSERDVAEALALAESDPELAAWLANHRSFDCAVMDKLREVAPPPGLRSAILAGIRVSRPRSWWRRPAVIAAAAAAVVFLAAIPAMYWAVTATQGAGGMAADNPAVERFRQDMIAAIDHLDRFDFASSDRGEIMEWLKKQGADTNFPMPETLGALPAAGCRVLDWEGNRASLICFRNSRDDAMPTVHLVVLEGDASLTYESKTPAIVESEEWSTAVWRKGGLTFLLASRGGADSIRRLTPLG